MMQFGLHEAIAIWRLSSKVSFVICRFLLHFGGFLARSSGVGGEGVCVNPCDLDLSQQGVQFGGFHYLLRFSNEVQ